MTKILMNWEDMTLSASGHANAAEKGKDIVCAGISALTQALLHTLLDAEERGRTRLTWKMDEAKGELKMTAIPYAGYWPEIRAYYRVTMIGLKAIAEEYPKHIKIGEVWAHGNL